MTKRFVAIGECMVEMAPTAEGTYSMGFAGDTLNTAWYARRMFPSKWDVSYLTAVGTDAVSDRMVAFMQDSGITTDPIQRRTDKTVGLYMIQLTNGERSFAYWRSDSAARCLAADIAHVDKVLASAHVVYFSGITIAVLPEADRTAFLAAVGRARAKGASVVFDPNLRPRLWPDVATMCAAIMDAAAVCDIALPSYEDEASYFGDKTPDDTAERYRKAGCSLVVVKNGPEEVVCVSGEGRTVVPVQPVTNVVDTTAAGDSFNAGFLAAYCDGVALEQAVQAGARLAGTVIGARGALVDRAETAA